MVTASKAFSFPLLHALASQQQLLERTSVGIHLHRPLSHPFQILPPAWTIRLPSEAVLMDLPKAKENIECTSTDLFCWITMKVGGKHKVERDTSPRYKAFRTSWSRPPFIPQDQPRGRLMGFFSKATSSSRQWFHLVQSLSPKLLPSVWFYPFAYI